MTLAGILQTGAPSCFYMAYATNRWNSKIFPRPLNNCLLPAGRKDLHRVEELHLVAMASAYHGFSYDIKNERSFYVIPPDPPIYPTLSDKDVLCEDVILIPLAGKSWSSGTNIPSILITIKELSHADNKAVEHIVRTTALQESVNTRVPTLSEQLKLRRKKLKL